MICDFLVQYDLFVVYKVSFAAYTSAQHHVSCRVFNMVSHHQVKYNFTVFVIKRFMNLADIAKVCLFVGV